MKAARWILVAAVAAATAQAEVKLPYKFGMTREQVRAVTACKPYTDVGTTGGLECPNFTLDKKRNVSFVFSPAGLAKMQFWFAESASHQDAEAAVDDLLAFLKSNYGALESNALAENAQVTRAALFAALDKMDASAQAKVQLKPKVEPKDAFVFASIFRDPQYGHYVFLYYTPPHQ